MGESKRSEIALESDDSWSQTEEQGVAWRDIDHENIELLKELNDALFPVKYHPNFYKAVLELPKDYAQFVVCDGKVIGAVCCKIESADQDDKLYIMTLGILAPYRGRGIGAKMLNKVLHSQSTLSRRVHEVYLHVQTSNVDALNFYKKHGFENAGIIHNYYKRLDVGIIYCPHYYYFLTPIKS